MEACGKEGCVFWISVFLEGSRTGQSLKLAHAVSSPTP